MARILVTGADGGLGRAWTRKLREPGLSLEPAFPGPVELTALTRAELDVSNPKATGEIGKVEPDIVLNCAGLTDLDSCEVAPARAFRVNRDGADHIARACSRRGALAVSFSTDLIFDGGKLQPYLEEDPPNPLNVYGESMLAGEVRTASLSRRHLIIRSGWIYGQPGSHILKALQGLERFQAIDTQIGQATWVRDFLDAALFLLRSGKMGRWHVGSPGAVTPFEAARRAKELLGGAGPPLAGRGTGMLAPLPGFTVLDIVKLEQAGHRMRGWEAGLEAYIKTIAIR